jgi:hypothetical protein
LLCGAAAAGAGVSPAAGADARAALDEDIAAARDPSPAARRLDHKLGGPPEQRRYTAPSYELASGDRTLSIPGFNPVEVYENAIANLAPELSRRPKPESVEALLDWASEPLATAEIVAIMQRDPMLVRAALSHVAKPIAAGADFYWTL